MTRTAASPRVERSRAPRLDTSTIWMAVASRTPASAASGMQATHCDATRIDDAAAPRDWVTAASRERAPERTLTAVRAMAAVAGMPPNSGTTRLAMPCPNSSRSESCRSPTLMPSATVADIRLSSAARAATATAGSSKLARAARAGCPAAMGTGVRPGSAPIVATGRWAAATTRVDGDDRDQRHRQAGAEPGGRGASSRPPGAAIRTEANSGDATQAAERLDGRRHDRLARDDRDAERSRESAAGR